VVSISIDYKASSEKAAPAGLWRSLRLLTECYRRTEARSIRLPNLHYWHIPSNSSLRTCRVRCAATGSTLQVFKPDPSTAGFTARLSCCRYLPTVGVNCYV